MLTINRSELVQALGTALRITRRTRWTPSRPVRLCHAGDAVRLEAAGSGSWLSQAVTGSGNGTVVTVDPGALHGAVSGSRAQEVVLDRDEGGVRLRADGMAATLPAAAAEPPVLSEDRWRACAIIPVEELQAALAHTVPFVCGGESRYALNGVSFRARRGEPLKLAASDTHRLSASTLGARASRKVDFILPTEAAALLLKMPGQGEVRVEVQAGNPTEIGFRCGRSWRFVTKKLDGRFPDYSRVIPEDLPHEVRLSCREFLAELIQAGQLCDPDLPRVGFRRGEDGVFLEAAHGTVACSSASGDVIPWACDWRYLRDALKVVRGTERTLRFADGKTPLRIDEGSWTHIIMPISGA